MSIFLAQAVINGIPNLFVSQSGIKTVGLLFCPQIIVISAKFILYSIDQEVYSQNREISRQESVYY